MNPKMTFTSSICANTTANVTGATNVVECANNLAAFFVQEFCTSQSLDFIGLATSVCLVKILRVIVFQSVFVKSVQIL